MAIEGRWSLFGCGRQVRLDYTPDFWQKFFLQRTNFLKCQSFLIGSKLIIYHVETYDKIGFLLFLEKRLSLNTVKAA